MEADQQLVQRIVRRTRVGYERDGRGTITGVVYECQVLFEDGSTGTVREVTPLRANFYGVRPEQPADPRRSGGL